MILVTLGTQFFPFDRSVRWLNELLAQGVIDEPVLLQHGETTPTRPLHPLVTAVYSLEIGEMQEAVRRSSLVVSHAGQGSARMLARLGARFVLLPRLKRHGEHIDDHQLLFAQAVARLGVPHCTNRTELARYILQPPAPFEGELFKAPSLADHLVLRFG
ncbi:glycosyltransferase [Gloeobacter morelensis]|uniref:Glucosyl transferase n=1 Tax=Gloeobacter morelensis MG652769 TaxID=2781736 RepID=A0ABY3PJ93_9CYAN|nr:glycosyltransferase [Gloeobacter morelensis]UFP93737.1 glucosyl transferase [Gloeobacter morelensis MG652769]